MTSILTKAEGKKHFPENHPTMPGRTLEFLVDLSTPQKVFVKENKEYRPATEQEKVYILSPNQAIIYQQQ